MLSRKINLENLITEEDKKKIKKCSSLLSEAYNLCLDSLRDEIDYKKINLITKEFSKQNKIHSKVTQNTGRECINAVKSYLTLKKKDPTARFPKNYRKYSPIIMDINLQKKISKKDESIHYNIGGGFSLYDKHIKIPFLNIISKNIPQIKPIPCTYPTSGLYLL